MVSTPKTYEAALPIAAAMCSRSECSAREIRKKLLSRRFPTDAVNEVVEWLYSHDFINDKRFAQAYINDKAKFSLWGRKKIGYQLRIEGIDPDIIEEAMAQIDDTEYESRLRDALSAKLRTKTETDPYRLKMVLAKWAMSRGFEASLVIPIINEMIQGADDIDAEDEI